MSLRKVIGTKIIAGTLAASMMLSTLTASAVALPTTEGGGKTLWKTVSDARAQELTPKATPDPENPGGEIPMPLSLDKDFIGFTEDSGVVEVTATMTDLQYLGVLTLEEYASFFPIGLDLDRVEYLTRSQRQYIASMGEEMRIAYRAQAEAKLKVKEQFHWIAVYNGVDYSDKVSFEPVKWVIHEATQDMAPSMECTVEISWIGEKPVSYGSDSSLDNLTGSESTGTRDISEESAEVQAFLYEMWRSGGLTQENSDYDLSYFEDGLYQPTGSTATDSGFNLMGGGSSTEGSGDQTTAEETDEENTGDAQTTLGTETDETSDDTGTAGTEEAPEEEENETQSEAEALLEEPALNTSILALAAQSLAAAAAENLLDGKEENAAESEDAGAAENEAEDEETAAQDSEEEGADGEDNEEEQDENLDANGLDETNAIFGVQLTSNEAIATYGYAIYLPTTVSLNDTDKTGDTDKTEDTDKTGETDETQDGKEEPSDGTDEKEEPSAGTDGGEETSSGTDGGEETSSGTDEKEDADDTQGQDTGSTPDPEEPGIPDAQTMEAVEGSYVIRLTAGESVTVPASQLGLQSAIGLKGVVDTSIAQVELDSDGNLVISAPTTSEGRTKVYAATAQGQFRQLVVEVTGLYLKSSADPDHPEEKFAIPMTSTFNGHTLALLSDGTVQGWGNAGNYRLTGSYLGSVGTPSPICTDAYGSVLEGIVMVAAGGSHSLALTKDGYVYAWGLNENGQTGTGAGETPYPTRVVRESDGAPLGGIVAIAAGHSHSLALDKDGNVWAWGRNTEGQLGIGTQVDAARAVQVTGVGLSPILA